MNNAPRTEFSQALKAIAQERGLDPDVILETIKQAIIAAYKRDAFEEGTDVEAFDYDAVIDPVNGETKVFAWPLPAEDATEAQIKEAKKDKRDVTPPGFGRIAAQTAKQVIHQKIREAEKGAIMEEFSERVGSLVSGLVLRFDGPNVRVDLGRTEAIMLAEDRIPSERLNLNQRLTFLIKAINETPRGKEIFLSRAAPEFVAKLFAREVPEISSNSVEIKAIAREAGVRTKVAVFSSQTGVDPVGSCVGQKGVRVQAVTNEIGGERVDVISWNDDPAELIKSSLSPAENLSVKLNNETKIATVSAPEDQLSMAIGKDGQNVRLTAKLTGFRIEVEGNGTISAPEEPIEEPPPAPVVKKITKTKAKKLAKKAKAAAAEEPNKEQVEEEPAVKIPEMKEELKSEDTK
ncbi:MAG: transcription termination factor NusA [Candidatus Microgenomates bacterium]|jgi:N utilization substance protein A